MKNEKLEITECYGTNILERHIKNIPSDKKHLIQQGFLTSIIGCRNAVLGLDLPEYSRHLFLTIIKQ